MTAVSFHLLFYDALLMVIGCCASGSCATTKIRVNNGFDTVRTHNAEFAKREKGVLHCHKSNFVDLAHTQYLHLSRSNM